MPNNRPNDKRWSKETIAIVAILLVSTLVFGILVLSIIPKNKVIDVRFTAFNNYVEEGEVSKATVDADGGVITFQLRGSKKTYKTTYPFSQDYIKELLLADVDVSYKRSVKIGNVIPYITFAILIYIVWKIFKGSSATSSKTPTSAKSSCTFKNVAGMKDIKADLMTLVKLLKDGEYKKKNIRVPKGILFQGPPGNGKTLLARAFAGECGMNFIAMNASDFGSPYVGVSGMKINNLFKEAKKQAPCAIFIDEIDAVGARRTSANNGTDKEMNSILTSLLNQLDGFEPNDDIIVIAATNRAEDIDEALLRPGRFDRRFTIPNPDFDTRKALYRLYTKSLKVSASMTQEDFAKLTSGCSCAMIENIINEAHIFASNRDREEITNEDFHDAIVRLAVDGVPKKGTSWDGKNKDIVAIHEAGHAIVAYFLAKTRVHSISIVPTTANVGGLTMADFEQDGVGSLRASLNRIAMLYGGKAAEEFCCGNVKDISLGASGDIQQATALAKRCVLMESGIDFTQLGSDGKATMSEKVVDLLRSMAWDARECIQTNQEAFYAVKNALCDKEELSEAEFLNIVQPFVRTEENT